MNRTALRCITGAKLGTSHQALENELELYDLPHIRYVAITAKFWQIQNREEIGRMSRLALVTSQERHGYEMRRQNDYQQVRCHTEQRRGAFLNTAIFQCCRKEQTGRINKSHHQQISPETLPTAKEDCKPRIQLVSDRRHFTNYH